MKKTAPLLLVCSFFYVMQLSAQCINGTKSYPLYKAGAKLVSELDEQGKEIVRLEYD
jgi:hypothetical protein